MEPGRRRCPGPEPPRGARRRPQRQPQPQRCPDPSGGGDGVDRISGLPDDLVREVLVRLRCARAAAQTSLLSHRWRGLWRHVPELAFRDVTADALPAVLAQVARPELSLLDINVRRRGYCTEAAVVSLLRTAARLAPVKFIFSAKVYGPAVEVPGFQRAKSIRLDLEHVFKYPLATGGEFPVLERLSVSGCHFSSIVDLISRCPRLRALQVVAHRPEHDPDIIRVHSTTIEELVVEGIRRDTNVMAIDVVAPVLERLSVSKCYFSIAELISRCPRLRVLQVRNPVPGYYPSSIKVYSTTIEELVVDRVHLLVGDIYVVAPVLKTFTLSAAKLDMGHIDLVAPVLNKFTLSACVHLNFRVKLSEPVVENLSLDCEFYWSDDELHSMWRPINLKLWKEEGVYVLYLHIFVENLGSQPWNVQEIAPLPNISVLKLHLIINGHTYGATVSYLLGICTDIRRLKLVIKRDLKSHKACQPKCTCDQLQNWRSQNIFFTALEVVEIESFGGTGYEVDLLKLLFRCSPVVKQVTVKPCPDTLPSIRACKEICNIFKAHPSAKCYVYDTCGKKVVYTRSAYASRCNWR